MHMLWEGYNKKFLPQNGQNPQNVSAEVNKVSDRASIISSNGSTWHQAPGIASHLQASSLGPASQWGLGHIGASAVSRRRTKLKVSAGWSWLRFRLKCCQLTWQHIASHHGHRSIHFHLATAVRASSAAQTQAQVQAQAQAEAICWGAWLQFGHGCTGSRSCAISNWNLSFMWPEARVVSAARGHCLARTSTSTRTRNSLHLGLFPCLSLCVSAAVSTWALLCLHCQQNINLRIMRVLKCNGKLSWSPKNATKSCALSPLLIPIPN